MFTWICPKCGHEVSPSLTECPDCLRADPPLTAPTTGSTPPQAKPLIPPTGGRRETYRTSHYQPDHRTSWLSHHGIPSSGSCNAVDQIPTLGWQSARGPTTLGFPALRTKNVETALMD